MYRETGKNEAHCIICFAPEIQNAKLYLQVHIIDCRDRGRKRFVVAPQKKFPSDA